MTIETIMKHLRDKGLSFEEALNVEVNVFSNGKTLQIDGIVLDSITDENNIERTLSLKTKE